MSTCWKRWLCREWVPVTRVIAVALTMLLTALQAAATVTITTTTNTATLANAIAAGNSGITLTGTPTLSAGSSTTVSGTFTTSGSALGLTSGIVLGTGNTSLVPGSPLPAGNLQTAGSAISNAGANEFDVATFTFSFIPNPGVNRMSIASVFASEEYNEYVNSTFTDNFSMVINGGAYSNLNVATIPGTSTGTDINTVNNGTNAGYYRDNSLATPAIPDIKMDGATRVFINAFDVVPGTTYTVTIRIADVGDNLYDSIAFVSTSTIINNPPALDLSAVASGTGYSTTWAQGAGGVAIAASDDRITDDGTTISSATITLNSPLATDVLAAGTLPAGITASSYNPATGVITLSGVATLADYQTALRAITYNSTATAGPWAAKTVTVVVNDGVDPSNTATTTIAIAALNLTKSASAPTVAAGTSTTLTDAGDTITYTYVVTNSGTVNLTVAKPVDAGPKFNGVAGTGTLSAFTPATATINAGANQTFTATYTLTTADVANGAGVTNGVANTATAQGTAPNGAIATSASATATTSITTVAGVTVTKTAGAPTTAAGTYPTVTDAGDTITFTYVVKNVGSVTLTNVIPADAGPKFNGTAGTNALSAFSPAAAVTLTAGSSQTFTATYTLSALDVSQAVGITNGVTNAATASGRNPAGTTVTSPVSNASTTITATPRLKIVKSFTLTDISGGTAGQADVNETVVYTYVVTNEGNTPITNVTIDDMHGTPATAVPVGGAGGITGETLSNAGPLGAGASSDGTANDGFWSNLAAGASATFTWTHAVTQAEVDHG